MIYLILIVIVLVCITIYFWKEMKHEKEKKEHYKTAYVEANDAWAEQSNAVRKKGIECAQWKKKFKNLERKLKKARITV